MRTLLSLLALFLLTACARTEPEPVTTSVDVDEARLEALFAAIDGVIGGLGQMLFERRARAFVHLEGARRDDAWRRADTHRRRPPTGSRRGRCAVRHFSL